jgi:hypothetical protein
MYFFGYGNFMYAHAAAQFAVHQHLSLRAGYQMGTRLSIHGTDNRAGLRLTQRGLIAGLEASW